MTLGVLHKILIFLLLFFLLHLYFFSEVTSFFSQDDFFHLSAIMDKQLTDIPLFIFEISREYAFYRPVSREIYNLLALNIFDLNPLPYHFINLSLILINGFLGLSFLTRIEKKLNTLTFKMLFLLMYLTSAVHSVELYYVSSVQTLIATLFMLLCLNYYLKKRTFALVFFVLGMMSHESSIVMLPILFIFHIVYSNKKIVERIASATKSLMPFILVFILRLLIHFFGFGLDQSTTYLPNFSLQTMLNTLLWYILWCFGMPEMLVDFVTLRLQFNPNLFKYYGYFVNIVFPAFIVAILTLGLILIYVRKIFSQKLFIFLLLAFFSSLFPLIFFPTHKFIYYLSFSTILFSGIISYACFRLLKSKTKFSFLVIIFLSMYLLISDNTLQINKITYWAAKRAKSAAFILKDMKNK